MTMRMRCQRCRLGDHRHGRNPCKNRVGETSHLCGCVVMPDGSEVKVGHREKDELVEPFVDLECMVTYKERRDADASSEDT